MSYTTNKLNHLDNGPIVYFGESFLLLEVAEADKVNPYGSTEKYAYLKVIAPGGVGYIIKYGYKISDFFSQVEEVDLGSPE